MLNTLIVAYINEKINSHVGIASEDLYFLIDICENCGRRLTQHSFRPPGSTRARPGPHLWAP